MIRIYMALEEYGYKEAGMVYLQKGSLSACPQEFILPLRRSVVRIGLQITVHQRRCRLEISHILVGHDLIELKED